jgi:predicted permease
MRDWRAYVVERLPEMNIPAARESEIAAELAMHLEQAYADACAAGCAEAEAMQQVEARFADWRELAREIERSELPAPPERPAGPFTGAAHDLRQALRFLRRNPAFAAIAVGTLAFGIGGNTAIFSMADALALRGLPYPQADRLMAIETRWPRQSEMEPWTAVPDFFDLRQRAQSFSAMAAISPVWNDVLTGAGPTERLETLYVSANFFPMLGARPEIGRTFTATEDNGLKGAPVAVLAHAFWERRFGARRDILGRAITLGGAPYTVIGVLPAGFRYLGEPLAGRVADIDVWMPLADNQIVSVPRGVRFLKLIGRIKPGVAPESAAAEIRGISQSLAREYPATNSVVAIDALPLQSKISGRYRVTMLLLVSAVGFVLLMACANVANLLLARAAARRKDIAVRVALGASRYRLLRQLVAEGMVLALAGGAVGLLLARWGIRFLAAAAPAGLIPGGSISGNPVRMDWRALAFTGCAVMVCALTAGLPPAWGAVREAIHEALRQGGRGLTQGSHRLRASLVIGEVALAILLLTGAGLLIRSFERLLNVNPGFDPHNLITVATQTPPSASTAESRAAIYSLIRERLLSIPGVTGVAAVSRLPLFGDTLGAQVYVEGSRLRESESPHVEFRRSTPNYFETMRIPLRRGRLFDEHDRSAAAQVAVIGESMERALWPGQSAIGKRIKLGPDPDRQPWVTVIGVVGDVRHFALDAEPPATVYVPDAYSPLSAPILVIRTSGNAETLLSTVAAKVRSADASIPAYNLYPMETLVDRSTAQRRFVMSLLAGFALAALLLACVGVYGTVSQSVTQRTQEIGLRMALGSSPGEAMALVFRDGMKLAALGIAIGTAGAAGLTQLMRKLLFEVQPLDPVAFAGAAALLAAFAALACYAPARRAVRVDPLVALRGD